MKLLAIDTATEACSAALLIDGEIHQHYQIAPREHSHLILKMIEMLLNEADIQSSELDALAFGRGPGSFMGIRIAAGVVQGIGFAHELPVVPVSTLQALALNAMQQTGSERVLAAIDARMNEVYWAAYEQSRDSTLNCVIDEAVSPPDCVAVPDRNHWLAAGTGWQSYASLLQTRCADRIEKLLPECFPSAAAIADIAAVEFQQGNTVPASAAVPVYLRDKVAKKPASKTEFTAKG